MSHGVSTRSGHEGLPVSVQVSPVRIPGAPVGFPWAPAFVAGPGPASCLRDRALWLREVDLGVRERDDVAAMRVAEPQWKQPELPRF